MPQNMCVCVFGTVFLQDKRSTEEFVYFSVYAVFAHCRARGTEKLRFFIGTNGAQQLSVWKFWYGCFEVVLNSKHSLGAKKGDFFFVQPMSVSCKNRKHVWHTRPKKASLKSNLSFHGKLKRSQNWVPHSKFGIESVEKKQSLRITGPSYRGVWMCIAGVWDLQTTSDLRSHNS